MADLPEILRAIKAALESLSGRVESAALEDIMIRIHDGKVTVVEVTSRHRVNVNAS